MNKPRTPEKALRLANNQLAQATNNQNLEKVQAAFAAGAQPLDTIFEKAYFEASAQFRNPKIISEYVKHGLENPERWAAYIGTAAEVVALIRDFQYTDGQGRTVLHKAANEEVADAMLIYGSPVNARDRDGNTPLITARTLDVAKRLVDAGADANAKNDYRQNALHLTHDPETIRFLESMGADVNARDTEGVTPLMDVDNAHAINALLELGADVNARDNNGRTALHNSRNFLDFGWRSTGSLEMLVKAGADVNARDIYGNTPLHCAVSRDEISQSVLESMRDKFGLDLHAVNNHGQSALHLTAEGHEAGGNEGGEWSSTGAYALIGLGLDYEAKDADGRTPRHARAVIEERRQEAAKAVSAELEGMFADVKATPAQSLRDEINDFAKRATSQPSRGRGGLEL